MIDLSEPLSKLRPFLRAYLAQQGVEIQSNGTFKCFVHNEKTPSANLIPGTDEAKWFCHVCNCGGDLLDACHHLEGRPDGGAGWYQETFLYLCDRFGIDVESKRELTAEEQKQMQTDQAFVKAAGLLLTMKKAPLVEAKLADYGWSKSTLTKFGIGSVSSYEKFVNSMVKMGFSKELLSQLGLDDKRIFRPECLIFTIKDAAGRPIAFSARYLLYEKEEKEGKSTQPKYVNTRFEKGHVLFGLHTAKGHGHMLYVFEGNADCVTAYDRGLVNAVAVCGSSFNERHLELCKENGVRHIVCAFDGDKGGEEGKRRFVKLWEEQVGDAGALRASLVDIPAGEGGKKQDPDELIRLHGLAKFLELARHSAFFWSIRTQASTDAVAAADLGTGRILLQPEPLIRYEMLEQLAQATGIPIEFLWEAVVRKAGQEKTETAAAILRSAAWMSWMREHEKQAKQAVVEAPAVPTTPPAAIEMLLATSLTPAVKSEKDKSEELAKLW